MEYNISFITGSPLVAAGCVCHAPVCVCVCTAAAVPGLVLSSGQGLPRGLWLDGPPCQTLSPSAATQDHTPTAPARLCYHKLSGKHNRGIMCWNALKRRVLPALQCVGAASFKGRVCHEKHRFCPFARQDQPRPRHYQDSSLLRSRPDQDFIKTLCSFPNWDQLSIIYSNLIRIREKKKK